MRYASAEQKRSERFKLFDLLLVVGLTLAPMTGLRVWKVGPAEVLCLIWAIRPLLKRRVRLNDTLSFFAVFLIAMSFGSVIGIYVTPGQVSPSGLLTWIYLAIIALGMYEGLSKMSLTYVEKLLRTFSTASILWYLFLFLYARSVGKTFLGAPLYYYHRYTGGALNPHQIAVMLCSLCFIFARQMLERRKVYLNLIFMALSVYLLIQTESSTGILAVGLGFCVFIYSIAVNAFPRSKVPLTIVMTLLLILIGLFIYEFLFERFMRWIASDSNGMGRITIFASFPETFAKSPIFGLGPGTHALEGDIEFHNTYLEIAAASGIVGFTAFMVYTVRIFRKTVSGEWKLFPVVCTMYAFGLAGFAMRRLVYWAILSFVLVIAEKHLQIQQTQKMETTVTQEMAPQEQVYPAWRQVRG
ncbi:MAG: O-antigen ligase family protein [Oscillospiraceae bacterium]|nr:O-antigen ligase family protein [Oscillospiraceae bacterium]